MILDHPPDEWLEQHCDGKLTGYRLAALEDHLLICEECRRRYAVYDEYHRMSAEALKQE